MEYLKIVNRIRKDNSTTYAFSIEAAQELSRNDSYSTEYGEDMWEEFYRELEQEFLEKEDSNDRR